MSPSQYTSLHPTLSRNALDTPLPDPSTLVMAIPPPPGHKTSKGALTENETSFILRCELIPEHRDDPNVLRFIQEYMKCRHARQAAQAAGLHPAAGPALRARKDIHSAIEALTAKSVQKYGYDATEIVERVKEIANVDARELEKPDGSYINRLSDLPPEVSRGIKRMKVKNIFGEDPNGMKTIIGEIIDVEFFDKTAALKMLGQEKKIFKEQKQITHDVGNKMASLLLESSKRGQDKFADLMDVTPVQLSAGKTEE